MSNSKKLMEKSSRRVYSRSDKAITLIALIVTIIVLLILAGVTINLAVNNQGIFNKAKTATRAFKNASENEQTGLDEADKEIAKYMPKEGSEGGSGSGSESSGGTSERENSGSSTSESSNASGTGGTVEKPTDPSGTGGTVEKPVVPRLTEDEVYGSTLKRKEALPITQENLIYADYNNDGYADGIIVADASGNAVTTDKIGSGDFADYSVKEFNYLNASNASNQAKVKGYLVTRTKASNKFYVLSLADYDLSTSHTWYKKAYGKMKEYNASANTPTSIEIGKGENNTRLMVQRIAYHSTLKPDYGDPTDSDIWQVLQTRPTGWFVPSKNEWKAFMTNLKAQGLTTSNYQSSFGLHNYYWSSSQNSSYFAWFVSFSHGTMNANGVNDTYSLRLCATF